jgi:hypothetical protein
MEYVVHDRLRKMYDNTVVRCKDCQRRHKEIFCIPGGKKDVRDMLKDLIIAADLELRREYRN